MASLYKVGRIWYVVCYFRGKRLRWSTGFESKEAAKHDLLNAEINLAAGKNPCVPSGTAIVKVIEVYLEYQQGRIAPRTLADRERYLKRFTEHFGLYMPITDITRRDAMDYQAARLNSGAGHVVINREMATIRHYFNYARDRELCEDNPFNRFKALPEARRNPRILSEEEKQTWFNWCRENDPLLYDLSVIAFYTGLRPSDTKKIEGAHVNLKTRTLTVSVSKLRGTKTLAIPLHNDARKVLARRKQQHGDGYLFPGREGGHLTTFRWRVNKARSATGLLDFTFGQFRHNCATWLIKAGASLSTVQELHGHASARTTERYVKLASEATREAINKLTGLGEDEADTETLIKIFTGNKDKPE